MYNKQTTDIHNKNINPAMENNENSRCTKKTKKDKTILVCLSCFNADCESELSNVKTELGEMLNNSNNTQLQGYKYKIELIKGLCDESFLMTLKDFFKYYKLYYLIALLLVLVVVLLAMFAPLLEVPKKEIIDICFNLYPSLIALGFGIYAFMLGLSRTILDKLQLFATDKKQPFHVLCASTIWFIFTSFLILLISLATKYTECQLVFAILQGLIGYSLFLFVDLLLHMFSIRTFFVPIKKQEQQLTEASEKENEP